MEFEDLQLRNDIQDLRDQNELLEFRILELEVKAELETSGGCSLTGWRAVCSDGNDVVLFRSESVAHLPFIFNNSISQKASVLSKSTVRPRESL